MRVFSRRSKPVVVAVTACTGLALFAGARSALAVGASQPTLVGAVPSVNTPNISDGAVYDITQVGQWVIAGGSFTSATSHGSSTQVIRNHVLAFDPTTGVLSSTFTPDINGNVNAVYPGPMPNTVYVGGGFTTVNGTTSRDVTLLNLSDGSIVSGFHPATLNGAVQDMRVSNGRLYLTGSFTTAGGVSHQGIVTLNPNTGAVDPFMNVQLTDHHNYNGTGAKGAVGGRAMDISPDGHWVVVVGNFKHADGALHDQIVMIDLTGSSAAIRTDWNTAAFSSPCKAISFDTYVRDVDFSPDGSYFAIATTGASTFSKNTDGTRSLCDSASRWETNATGSNVQPTWIDYTGNDTLWSVVCTGTALYAGGHQRWANNPNGSDRAAAGAIPRPGIMALDPVNGMPMAWNPGRNPRGAGAYALFATNQGLYVGSDTDYIGAHQYLRQKIAFFPIGGGESPPSTSTDQLPGNLYLAGPTNTGSTNSLVYRPVNGSTIGGTTTVGNNISWSTTRGVFMVGDTIFYSSTDGSFGGVPFDGTTVGTPAVYDPYDDPFWDTIQTGSGQTYQGVKPTLYSVMSSITGAFYWDGRMYYTRQGSSSLFWRYFEPDDGAIGGQEFTVGGANLINVAGMALSGSTLYYANKNDGTLHSMPFVNGTPNGNNDTTISGPGIDGNDWRARGLFILDSAGQQNQPPVAVAQVSCTQLTCNFDGSQSTDDGTITSYAWTFGDSASASGENVSHTYAAPGPYNVTLTVTDNDNATDVWSGTASPTTGGGGGDTISYVGEAHSDGATAAPSVTLPPGIASGDTELLFLSTGQTGVTTQPTGWTQVAQVTNSPLETTVFRRTAAAGDSGSTVTVPLTASVRADLQFVAYDGAAANAPQVDSAVDAFTATHVAPATSVPIAGSWLLTYWADRSSSTTAWTLPASVTSRAVALGSGGGRVTSALGDSAGPVPTGVIPARTATVDGTSGKGVMLSVVLAPGF